MADRRTGRLSAAIGVTATGGLLVVAGISLISIPHALIAAGAMLAAGGLLIDVDGDDT